MVVWDQELFVWGLCRSRGPPVGTGKPRDERTTRTQDGRFALFEVAPSGPDLGVAELNIDPQRRPGRF